MSRSRPILCALMALTLFALPVGAADLSVEVSLRGSPTSMMRQNNIAKELGYTFVDTPEDLDTLIQAGKFVALPGNDHYEVLGSVSYPYARPEVRMFIERLARQYHEGTGEQLVVTSLTRPRSEQPRNSHELSVHPAGIAIDLRISDNQRARAWLESVLLRLENRKVLDVTRERWPPHYHVARFPNSYRAYVEELIGPEAVAAALVFNDELEVQEIPKTEDEIAGTPASTVASAVGPADSGLSGRRLLFAALPLSALIFFLLGYRRGRRNSGMGDQAEGASEAL